MSTLKKSKLLQMIIGVLSAVLLLFAGYILGEKISFPETDFWNKAEPIIFVGYMLIYIASLSLLAIFAKSHDLKFLYYPAFAICLTSTTSALLHWRIEESLWLIVMPLSEYFGLPIRAVTRAIEKLTTYTVYVNDGDYSYDYEETLLWEHDTLNIFVIITFISIIVYQLYTETAEQDITKGRWRIEGPARTAAIATIASYGTFIITTFLCYLVPQNLFTDIIGVVLAHLCIAATFFIAPVTLPVILICYMLMQAFSEARQCSNPRLYFNPLVISAITICILGSVIMVKTMLSCF